MVRQEDTVLVLFRMREVVLRSSLSGVGVYQHIRRSVTRCALNGLHIAAGDHQLIGCAGMPQTMENNTGELRVCVLPFQELFADEHRLHRQTVGQTEQHTAVMVACRIFHLVCR